MSFSPFWTGALLVVALQGADSATIARPRVVSIVPTMPAQFVPNEGQWPEPVSFGVHLPNGSLWFAREGIYHQISGQSAPLRESSPNQVRPWTVKSRFVGANPSAALAGRKQTVTRYNFFLGDNPAQWRSGVPGYESIQMDNAYAGIDIIYHTLGSKLEYDVVVNPGGNIQDLEIAYEGIDSLRITAGGHLEVCHPYGTIRERNAVVYQCDDSVCRVLDAEFVLRSPNSFGFRLKGSYNASLAVVIDPIIEYASYVGASGSEEGTGLTLDTDDNIYICGRVFSTPTLLQSPYDATPNGNHDAYITKLSADGQLVLYSTYFGGNGMDYAMDLVLDTSRNMYLSGWTNSTNLPLMNPLDSSWNGGLDGILFTLSADGGTLLYSTYFGGSGNDYFPRCALDSDGAWFAVGQTNSPDFPLQAALDSTHNGGDDFALVKLAPSGAWAAFSSYFGGAGDDYLTGFDRNNAGDYYLGGVSFAAGFPLKHPLDSTFGGSNEGVLCILDASLDSIISSTYLGGSGSDNIGSVFVTPDGSVYLAGSTRSNDFPGKKGYDTSLAAEADMLIAKLNQQADSILFATYLGGNGLDVATSVHVDPNGAITVGGFSVSTDMPTSAGGFQPSNAGQTDGFIARFTANGDSLLYGTYVGSGGQDDIDRVAVRQGGSLLFMGSVGGGGIATVYPLQSNTTGPDDVFLIAINFSCCAGVRGNLDGDSGDGVDISDLQVGVDFLFFDGALGTCEGENNVDGTIGFDISDLQGLIDFLFFSSPLMGC